VGTGFGTTLLHGSFADAVGAFEVSRTPELTKNGTILPLRQGQLAIGV